MPYGSVASRLAIAVAAGCPLALAGVGAFAAPDSTAVRRAQATITQCGFPANEIGFAALHEQRSEEGVKEVRVTLVVTMPFILTPGKHGVHIHENAACEPCTAAGGHFDPGPFGNSNPDGNHPFHLGELVNMEVGRTGLGALHAVTTRVTLSKGPISIFDFPGDVPSPSSAFIIHLNEDTYCPNGPVAGCAGGGRAACGIIEPGP
jgi:Cu/Zn superoxide dismutase